MRMHDTLWQTSSTRCVHDVEQVIIKCSDHWLGCWRRVNNCIEVLSKRRCVVCTTGMNPKRNIGLIASRMQLSNSWRELFAIEQHRATRIFKNKFQLIWHKTPVQRNNYPTNFRDSKERSHVFMRVHHEQRNAITLFHLGCYGVHHLVRSVIQFPKCESTTCRDVIQRLIVWI